jgi:pimeloyl-ACP methyl ester carboxylesterase
MTTSGLPRLEPLQSMRAGVQEVAYYQAGPADGDPVLLVLHDFPYDIHSYECVIPRLADRHERGSWSNTSWNCSRRADPDRFTMSEATELRGADGDVRNIMAGG